MADEDRSFATKTASSKRTQLQEGGETMDQPTAVDAAAPDIDAVEADAEADEDSALVARKAEVDRFQGAKTRHATKDIISRMC